MKFDFPSLKEHPAVYHLVGLGLMVLSLTGWGLVQAHPALRLLVPAVAALPWIWAGISLRAGRNGDHIASSTTIQAKDDANERVWTGALWVIGIAIGLHPHLKPLYHQVATPLPSQLAMGILLAGAYIALLPVASTWLLLALVATQFSIAWANLWGHLAGCDLHCMGVLDDHSARPQYSYGLLLVGILCAALGAHLRQWRQYFDEREDRKLTLTGSFILLTITTSLGVTSVIFTASAMLANYDSAMSARVEEDAAQFRMGVSHGTRDIELALAQVGRLRSGESAVELRKRLQMMLIDEAIVSLRLQSPGQSAQLSGPPPSPNAPQVVITPNSDSVLWQSPPHLIITRSLQAANGGLVDVTVNFELNEWVVGQLFMRRFGASGETLFCSRVAEQSRCLPTRFRDSPFIAPNAIEDVPLPMTMALDGLTGTVVAKDYRGVVVKAAYTPVLPGIGIVHKVDLDEVMQPGRKHLMWVFVLITGIACAGAWILYRGLAPLAKSLRMERRKQQAILSNAPSAVFTTDMQGRITSCNKGGEHLLGMPAQKTLGLALQQLITDMQGNHIQEPLHTLTGQRIECMVTHATRGVCPAEGWISEDEFERRRYLIAVFNDNSAALGQQAKLEKMAIAFDHAPWGIVVRNDGELNFDMFNPSFAQMHGYTTAEVSSLQFLDMCAPSVRPFAQSHIDLAHRKGSYTFESLHVRKDGTEFPVQVNIKVAYHPDGEVRLRVIHIQDITARKDLEQKLRESERVARVALDTQQDFIVRWNCDTTVTFCNQAYADLCGHTKHYMTGRRWLDILVESNLLVENDLAHLRAKLAQLTKNPRPTIEIRAFIRPDGGHRWIEWSDVPLFEESSVLVGYQSTGRDVTAQTLAQQALLERKNLLKAIFDSTFQYVAILDATGLIVECNRNFLELVGVSHAETLGRQLNELNVFRSNSELCALLSRGVEQASANVANQFEAKLSTEHLGQRALDFVVRPVPGPDELPRQLILEAYDKSELAHKQLQLESESTRFLNFAQSAAGIVIEFGSVDAFVPVHYLNPGAAANYPNLYAGCVHGMASLLDFIEVDATQSFRAALRTSQERMQELRWTGALLEQPVRWIEWRAMPRHTEQGPVWSGVGIDITEVTQRTLALEHSRLELRQLAAHHESVREDERRSMAREVHDELGQVLTALRMGLAVLQEQTAQQQAHSEAQRLKNLADQAIAVVRKVATSLRPAALDLGAAAALKWLASEFETHTRIKCKIEVDASGVTLSNDASNLLYRVAQESLTNIARHAQATSVWILLRRVNRHLILEVGDNGCGFDVQSRTGQGFGLLSMKERALSQAGQFSISSIENKGTVVTLSIQVE